MKGLFVVFYETPDDGGAFPSRAANGFRMRVSGKFARKYTKTAGIGVFQKSRETFVQSPARQNATGRRRFCANGIHEGRAIHDFPERQWKTGAVLFPVFLVVGTFADMPAAAAMQIMDQRGQLLGEVLIACGATETGKLREIGNGKTACGAGGETFGHRGVFKDFRCLDARVEHFFQKVGDDLRRHGNTLSSQVFDLEHALALFVGATVFFFRIGSFRAFLANVQFSVLTIDNAMDGDFCIGDMAKFTFHDSILEYLLL